MGNNHNLYNIHYLVSEHYLYFLYLRIQEIKVITQNKKINEKLQQWQEKCKSLCKYIQVYLSSENNICELLL